MSVLWDVRSVPAEAARQIDVERLPDEDLCDHLFRLSREELDLGRNWQIVHYLLTGEADADGSPLSWTIFGRHNVDEHSHFLTPDDVKVTANALADVNREEIALRLQVENLHGLYFGHAYDHDGLAGCVDDLEDLRDLYLQWARHGMGAFIHLG